MEKLQLKTVYIDPKNGYKLVDTTDPRFKTDAEGNGYLILEGNSFQRVIKTFMVEGHNATNPIWFKKLKNLGIVIETEAILEVEHTEEDEFSYRHGDKSYTKVPFEKVLTENNKAFFTLIDGVIQKLFKRTIKKYTINGINVGSEYYFNKLLGLNQPAKK